MGCKHEIVTCGLASFRESSLNACENSKRDKSNGTNMIIPPHKTKNEFSIQYKYAYGIRKGNRNYVVKGLRVFDVIIAV